MTETSLPERITAFLDGGPHAVVGASRNRDKYGNKVLRVYLQHERPVFPVNPTADVIEGLPAFADLASLPETPHGVSVITPPEVTALIVDEAIRLGIRHIWMQPGAENQQAVELARQHGINVIAGDACILVAMGYTERDDR